MKAINLTPDQLRCSYGGCPSLHEIEGDRYLIVGANASFEEKRLSGAKEGAFESTIVIDKALLGKALAEAIADEIQRRERAEEELECLSMLLDANCVPRKNGEETYSLVGRVLEFGNRHGARSQSDILPLGKDLARIRGELQDKADGLDMCMHEVSSLCGALDKARADLVAEREACEQIAIAVDRAASEAYGSFDPANSNARSRKGGEMKAAREIAAAIRARQSGDRTQTELGESWLEPVILPLGKGGQQDLVQTDVQQVEKPSGHPNAVTVAAMEEARAGGLMQFDSIRSLIAHLDSEASSQQTQALSGHLDFEARAREIAGQLSYPLDDNWRDKPFLRLLVDEAATRNHALIAAALREVSELGAPSHLGMKARLALLNAAEAEYERNLGPLTPAEVKSHIAELMSRKTEHVNEIERLAKALIRARQELDAAGNQIRADGKPHHADDIVITIEVIDEVLSQVGIASAPRQSEEPHRGNARAEEAALADALNCRDAYGVVVSRLIEWFGDPANGLFDKEDYQAIMMDAGLMDREDYHVLLRRARRLFDLPLRQIEEPQSGDTAAHLASGSPDTAKMPPYEYQKEDNRSFAVSYAEPKILPKPIIPETGH
jgi:hypothetical protein